MTDSKPQIVMRSGPIPGASYYLDKPEVSIGRDLANDIPVPDSEISRRHARFIVKVDGVYIEDLGSTNGTFLNGVRLSAPKRLANGDLVTLAENTVMSFEWEQAAQVADKLRRAARRARGCARKQARRQAHDALYERSSRAGMLPRRVFARRRRGHHHAVYVRFHHACHRAQRLDARVRGR